MFKCHLVAIFATFGYATLSTSDLCRCCFTGGPDVAFGYVDLHGTDYKSHKKKCRSGKNWVRKTLKHRSWDTQSANL